MAVDGDPPFPSDDGRPSISGIRALTATAVLWTALGLGAATGPTASAQPEHPSPEAVAACAQFARALDLASASYSQFADVLALGAVNPDYTDPLVAANNSYGRTGLRQAFQTARSAAGTPGLRPEIAAPMRSWSMGAMKLMVLMGLRADVDRINAAATALNQDATNAQMACAHAGTHA